MVDVAKRLGIREGVLYSRVSKFKKSDAPQSSDHKTLQAELAKLKGSQGTPQWLLRLVG